MATHIAQLKSGKPYDSHFFHSSAFGLHTHAHFEIMITLSDGGRHWVNDQEHPVRRGDIFLLGPYHLHRADYGPPRAKKHFNLAFNAGAVFGGGASRTELWRALSPFLIPNFPLPLRLPEDTYRDLLPLLELLVREGNGDGAYREQIASAALQTLVFTLARHFPKTETDHDAAVLATLTRIADRFREDVTTRELASAESLSPARLAQRFRKATGYTIKDALTQRRLLEARRLLEGTTLSVTEVMTESGFNDLSYFNRAFKKAAGKSPRAYREKARS